MSIKLPSSLAVSGVVVDAAAAVVSGFTVRAKLLAPDGAAISVISDGGTPIEATTGTDGSFSLSIKDSSVIKQLLTQGYSVLFKSGADDAADTLDVGLSRSTPLHVNSRQSVQVVLEWQAKQAGDMTKPAVSAKLRVRSVSRDGELQPAPLVIAGQVEGPQGLPVGELTITASFVVPGTGQSVEFPRQDNQPTSDTSTPSGSFQITLARAGDLIPYQPYSMYGIRFTARPAHTQDRAPAKSAATATLCHLSLTEATQVKLRWDATDPAKPQLSVECVRRNGVACQPAEGTLQALGQLVENGTSKPLIGYRVQIQAGAALKSMGEVRTRAKGFFPLAHPWPLATATDDSSLQWKLQVLDPAGNPIAKDVTLTQEGMVDAALVVKATVATPKDLSPTVAQLLTSLAKTLDTKTQAALDAAKIKTLQDVIKSGGLHDLKGTAKADDPTLTLVEQAADLWSLLPPSVSAANAVPFITAWLGKGLQGTAHLGNLPRAAGTAALKGQLGDFAAAQTHAIAVARNNLLNFVLLGSRVEANQEKSSRRTALRSDTLTRAARVAGLLPEETEQPCSCEECQTAVSPNAYLVDLIRYAYFRVQNSGAAVAVEDLQTLFFQPLADLPVNCDAMQQPVLTTRLAIEILRGYGATITLSTDLATAKATKEAAYRQQAYDAILAELGTSRTELRLALGHDDQLNALADRLSVPSKTQVQQLLLSSTDLANETILESRFGLRASTHAALDPSPATPPDLLTWRLQRLQTAWATQDAPTVFPATVPILDPDVLDFSNLRQGWDSISASTGLWTARRAAVDAQLASRAKSRAMAVGAAILTITQPAVTTPTEAQKWAAYLTVSVSEDEIQSMAATLALDHQDEAKLKAATKKVLARSGSTAPTSDELATINAILNYTGTTLNQQVQTAAETWVDLQFTSLTPTSGAALSIGGWLAIQVTLKGSVDSATIATATQDLARFNFSVDSFLRAFDLKLKLHDQGFRTLAGDEWAEFDAIFVAIWKVGQVATWVTAEQGAGVKVTADLFWQSPDQPAQRKWLGSEDRYQQWLAALQDALSQPIILPALTRASAFLSTASNDPPSPYDLLVQRTTWATSAAAALQNARALVEAAATGQLALFDDKVLAASLLIPKSGSAAKLWFEPDQLQAAYDKGTMSGAHLGQLLLDRNGFQGIFALRSLIRDGKVATDQEWTPVLNGLLKTELQRQYGAWRTEEASAGISLSPVFFRLPAPQALTFPPQASTDDDPAPLFTKAELQRWRGVLGNRIAQQARVNQDQSDTLDRVEQAVLGGLRDALVGIYGAGAGFPISTYTDSLTDRLLFDFADSPTNKTTRVAQAIATIQLLLFSLRTGNLFRLRTATTTTQYPDLTLEAEHFDTEWQWLGSYGSWRSALFIFMYPENLLYPTLRDPSEQSQPFKDLVETMRSSGSVTPESVKALGKQYRDYYGDVGAIVVQTSCLVTVPVASTSLAPDSPSTQDLCLLFGAVPSGGRAYWSSRALDASLDAKQSLWNPIPGWGRTHQILGAVPSYSKAGRHRVSVIAQILDDTGTPKLQVHNLDLDLMVQGVLPWGDSPKDLGGLPTSTLPGSPPPSVVVEQIALLGSASGGTPRSPHVYVGVLQPPAGYHLVQMEVYRRALNDDATGWAGNDWAPYLCDTVPDCISLIAGFMTSSYLDPEIPNLGYQFIAQKVGLSYPANSTPNYGKLFSGIHSGNNGIDLNGYFGLGETRNVALIGGSENSSNPHYLLLTGTSGAGLLSYAYDSPYFSGQSLSYTGNGSSVDYVTILPQSAETHVTIYYGPVIAAPAVTSGNYMILYVDLYAATLNLDGFYGVTKAPSYNLQDVGSPLAANEDSWESKLLSQYEADQNLTTAMLLHCYEAYFALPMHIASQLQQAGFYREALDWYRKVYDHTKHEAIIDENYGDVRKIYFGLVQEETEPTDDYLRTQRWMADPFNPHAIAAMRQNAYTRFTLLMIIRCLLDYADSEFASDSAESVPQARALYLEALQWANADELALPEDCSAVVAQMDFSFVPNDWLGTTEQLQASLVSAMGQLSPTAGSQLRSAVISTLKDTATPKWGNRFAKAAAAIRAAIAAAPKPPKLAAAFKADRKARQAAHLALLAMPQWGRTDVVLRQQVGRHFRDKVSVLTGVAGDTLMGDTSIKLDWLARPARSRGATQDPAKRSPAVALPATAVSRAFKQRWRWDPLSASRAGLAGQELQAAPARELAFADLQSVQFVPTSSVSFCIPPNPVINALQLRGQLNLYKLRSGRNISGLQRQLDFYSAPTDAQTGLPALSANGGLALPTGSRLGPTEFRYAVLIDRARRQIQVAAQFESQLLQALEQTDNQRENLLRARNELETQQATLNLKNLEIQEAQLGVSLVKVQQERNLKVHDYYDNLIRQDLTDLEKAALDDLTVAAVFQGIGAGLSTSAGLAQLGAGITFAAGLSALASAASGVASVFSTVSQRHSMLASFQRRKQDWQQQLTLADSDAQALTIQYQQADLGVKLKQEDRNITTLQIKHAQSVVDFLVTKFTTAELFEWMSRILQGLYAGQLQQATATARLAQQQLAFDVLQGIDVIQTDYWTVPVNNASPSGALAPAASGSSVDRKGLTGAERLQRATEQLDEIAQQQTTRKLQLTRTLSLATLYPGDFQRLKETGEMWFSTTEQDFDLEFPGHYFRRLRKVKLSVLALVPAARGIRATLSNIGPSRVTVPDTVGFTTQTLPPSNDSVSFTAPQNASGLFDLDIQPDLNLPFEGVGVDSLWHFEMPMPANPMDFGSIADVQVTFEYTALYSPDYRAELLANPVKLPRTFSAVRVFSFRNELIDQWYALHNAPLAPTDLRATFTVSAADFPSNMSNIRVRRLTLYMPLAPDDTGSTVDLSKDNLSKQIGLAFGANAAPALQALNSDALIAAQSAADPWFRQLPARTLSPFGTWTLVLPATQILLDLLRADQIKDILFAITYEADLPEWPTGLRPKRALF